MSAPETNAPSKVEQIKSTVDKIIRGPQYIAMYCHVCRQAIRVYSTDDGTWKPKQPCMHIAIEGVFKT